MKIGLLPFDYQKTKPGSAVLRMYNLLKHFPEAEVFKVGRKYDVVIYQKYYWHEHARQYNGIKILDICDPDWFQRYDIFEFIELCDAVTCSSRGIYNFLQDKTSKPVYYVPDRHDTTVIKGDKQHKGNAKSCVWYGYSQNSKAITAALPKLSQHKIKLVIVADLPPRELERWKLKYKDMKFVYKKWTSYPELVTEILKTDFALLPASPTPMYRFKSNNKTTLCWHLGMPVAQFAEDVDRLVDAKNRIKDAKHHKRIATLKYTIEQSAKQYKKIIKELRDVKNKRSL